MLCPFSVGQSKIAIPSAMKTMDFCCAGEKHVPVLEGDLFFPQPLHSSTGVIFFSGLPEPQITYLFKDLYKEYITGTLNLNLKVT